MNASIKEVSPIYNDKTDHIITAKSSQDSSQDSMSCMFMQLDTSMNDSNKLSLVYK